MTLKAKILTGSFFQAGLDLLGKGAEAKEWGNGKEREGDVLNISS